MDPTNFKSWISNDSSIFTLSNCLTIELSSDNLWIHGIGKDGFISEDTGGILHCQNK